MDNKKTPRLELPKQAVAQGLQGRVARWEMPRRTSKEVYEEYFKAHGHKTAGSK